MVMVLVPDEDADNVNNEEDKCPNVVGASGNFGCPVIPRTIIEQIDYAAKNVLFTSGSGQILVKSYTSLNAVVKIMNDDVYLKLEINGYTDNTGDSLKNKLLSETRANTVKAYLKAKGIAENRMITKGFGSENSIGNNKTAAGRAKNRRVELRVTNY
ncbi:MAG: OmpA family protein [Sphingobacteriales bacterium]|nr:OmpA family protein [Sphingobacteriales bacterium]